jgi:hypothetical protein
MPVEYPQVIMAIKQWIGQHQIKPDPSVEVSGSPVARKASGSEMLSMAFKELATTAATAGIALGTGGTEGFNKYFDSLPKELKEPVSALKDTFGNLTNSLPAGVSEALTSFKQTFINPIGDTLSSFKDAVTGNVTDLTATSATYLDNAGAETTISSALKSAANDMGTTIKSAIDKAKSWSDNLSLGGTTDATGKFVTSNFTLSDAISSANNAGKDFLSTYVGITQAPSLTDMVGTLTKDHLTANFSNALVKEKTAREQDLTVPANFAAWQTAHEEVVAAADAINSEVDVNQQNVARMLQQDTVLDGIANVTSSLNDIKDPDAKALYAKTMDPNLLATAQAISPLLNASQSPPTIVTTDPASTTDYNKPNKG